MKAVDNLDLRVAQDMPSVRVDLMRMRDSGQLHDTKQNILHGKSYVSVSVFYGVRSLVLLSYWPCMIMLVICFLYFAAD